MTAKKKVKKQKTIKESKEQAKIEPRFKIGDKVFHLDYGTRPVYVSAVIKNPKVAGFDDWHDSWDCLIRESEYTHNSNIFIKHPPCEEDKRVHSYELYSMNEKIEFYSDLLKKHEKLIKKNEEEIKNSRDKLFKLVTGFNLVVLLLISLSILLKF